MLRGALLVLIVACLLHICTVSQGWHNALEGIHGFRQTQTAISCEYLNRDGLRLDYPLPVFGSPTSLPFEFPTFQFIVVEVERITGWGLDACGRLVSLTFFYGTLVALAFGLRALRAGWPAICFSLAAILATPAYVYFSRTFLIESTATFFGAGAFAAMVALEDLGDRDPPTPRRRVLLFAFALIFGGIAALTKITTWWVFAVAIGLLWSCRRGVAGIRTQDWTKTIVSGARILAILVITAVVGIAWAHYAEHARLRNPTPMIQPLVGKQVQTWLLGERGVLLHVRTLRDLYANLTKAVTGSFMPEAVLLLVLFVRRHRVDVLCLLGAFAAGPLVFTNVYVVHDYYWYANAWCFAAAIGLLLGSVVDGGELTTSGTRWVLPCLLLAAQFVAYRYSPYFADQKFPPRAQVAIAEAVAADTPSESSIVIFGQDWDPTIPYYAHRRALMIPWQTNDFFNAGTHQALERMIAEGHPVGAVIFGGETAGNFDLQRKVLAALPMSSIARKAGAAIVYYRNDERQL